MRSKYMHNNNKLLLKLMTRSTLSTASRFSNMHVRESSSPLLHEDQKMLVPLRMIDYIVEEAQISVLPLCNFAKGKAWSKRNRRIAEMVT